MRHIARGGTYYRVCDPSWSDPSDTSYSKRYGGRWNAAGAFGALYLNRTLATALANAQRHVLSLFGAAASLYDFRPEALPELQYYTVANFRFVDAVTARGIREAGLPKTFPVRVSHATCQRVATNAFGAGEAGIASASAVLASGEELAIFDLFVSRLAVKAERLPFAIWSRNFEDN